MYKRFIFVLLFILVLLVALSPLLWLYSGAKRPPTPAEVYESSKQSVGMLDVTHSVYFPNPKAQIFFFLFPVNLRFGGCGTAWFFDKDRPYIMTNSHVITRPKLSVELYVAIWKLLPDAHKKFLSQLGTIEIEIKSTFVFIDHNGKKHDCILIADLGQIEDIDLAVLSVDIKKWKALQIGNPNKIDVTDSVYAIGSPVAYINIFNIGNVTGIRRKPGYRNKRVLWTIHDAHINPGNSGGPLLNKWGEVVGVNTMAPNNTSGMSMALNIDAFKPLYFWVKDRSREHKIQKPPSKK